MKTGWQIGTPWLPRVSVILLLAAGTLVSCYPGDIENIDELDTVATLFDDSFPFSQQSTYSMPDSVFHLCEVIDSPPSDCIQLSRSNDTLILNTVRARMVDYGWTLIPDDDSQGIPDVRVGRCVPLADPLHKERSGAARPAPDRKQSAQSVPAR